MPDEYLLASRIGFSGGDSDELPQWSAPRHIVPYPSRFHGPYCVWQTPALSPTTSIAGDEVPNRKPDRLTIVSGIAALHRDEAPQVSWLSPVPKSPSHRGRWPLLQTSSAGPRCHRRAIGVSSRFSSDPWGWGLSVPPKNCSNTRAIDYRSVPVYFPGSIQLLQKYCMDFVPRTIQLPIAKITPAGHTGAAVQLCRQVFPGNTGLEDKENAGKCLPVGHPGTTTLGGRLILRQKGLKELPKMIG